MSVKLKCQIGPNDYLEGHAYVDKDWYRIHVEAGLHFVALDRTNAAKLYADIGAFLGETPAEKPADPLKSAIKVGDLARVDKAPADAPELLGKSVPVVEINWRCGGVETILVIRGDGKGHSGKAQWKDAWEIDPDCLTVVGSYLPAKG